MSNILQLRESKHGLTFDIQVTPHAASAQVVGVQEGMLKIMVTALPVEGAANEACIKLLAKTLALKKKPDGNICRREITQKNCSGKRH